MSQKQGQALGVETGKQISPYLELCCLRISANVSYANAESDVAMLTGMTVSDNTQQRLVQASKFPVPVAEQPINEACVDGGKVRLRTPPGEICIWRDYKAIATDQGIVANLHQNQSLIDWINHQPLKHTDTCLGDGHDGVWNIIAAIASPEQRREILDWYHLNENLQKVGGSLKRLRQAEAYLWKGQVDETIALFVDLNRKQAHNFCTYLESIATASSTMATTKRRASAPLVLEPLSRRLSKLTDEYKSLGHSGKPRMCRKSWRTGLLISMDYSL